MSKKKSNKLQRVALVLQQRLHFPVCQIDGEWWGGLIYQPTGTLKYVVALEGHACRNGRKGDANYYLALDIKTTDGEYRVYDVAKNRIITLNEYNNYAMGLALLVTAAKKGQKARTSFGPFPPGASFNLSFVNTLMVA